MTPQNADARLPPIIVTAHGRPDDMAYFNSLRRAHFPPERNFLDAHITVFHHLPGRLVEDVTRLTRECLEGRAPFNATVCGVRHLGGGVAFDLDSDDLHDIRADLFRRFGSWPGPQDRQKFKPHITVQNKVSRDTADELYAELRGGLHLRQILICGFDLWHYLGGPWQHHAFVPLHLNPQDTTSASH